MRWEFVGSSNRYLLLFIKEVQSSVKYNVKTAWVWSLMWDSATILRGLLQNIFQEHKTTSKVKPRSFVHRHLLPELVSDSML